jgi:hypothetical protein
MLAAIFMLEGELEHAIGLYRQATGFTSTTAAQLAASNLSCALVDANRLAEADQIMETRHEQGLDADDKVNLARIRIEQGEVHEAADLLHYNIDEVQAIGGAAFSDCLRVAARLAGLTSQPETAARLLGAADSSHPNPNWPFARGDRGRATPPAEQALGSERFQQLYTEGQELALEEASSLVRVVADNTLLGSPKTADQAADPHRPTPAET